MQENKNGLLCPMTFEMPTACSPQLTTNCQDKRPDSPQLTKTKASLGPSGNCCRNLCC